MTGTIRTQLSIMMFLEFFVWGGWYVTMGIYLPNTLGSDGSETAMAYSTQSYGAILAPFVIGLIADRYFNAERILGILHLLGAVLMYLLYQTSDFTLFFPYLLAYMIMYMSTLALVNSVSFNQMKDPGKEFGFVRVFGTVGWIASGMLISYLNWDSQQGISEGLLRNTFLMSAIASAVLGLFSFTLPKTPPRVDKSKKISLSDVLGLDALSLLKDRNFLVFFLASVLISIPLAFYYQHAGQFLGEIGVANPAFKMSFGQVSELVFMLLLPFFFKRFGFKMTMLVAMFAWGLRYLLFAYGDTGEFVALIVVGIALHGVCYDFFFVSGQIYTDSKAGKEYKSAAQGLITLATYGVGMLIGFWAAGEITDAYLLSDGVHDWRTIWLFPAGFAFLVLLLFGTLFKDVKISYKT
ncbi:nucleoside permease [Pricia sp. S334]|uniref:Nucleoside permease n=1 Tax=Pricia mediterranea TaxID=3076079 RepID=A0ABU3L5U3_9FLAO|nr:nucleoside permease [Pricia sp. S334]MDT7829100.1 nucleoside permease [Pricia sp. S334]